MDRRRRRVVWSEGARLELEQAIDHIAREHPLSASGVLGRVLGAARSLGTLAERGRTVPEWDDPAVRELLVDPFRLIYKVRPQAVDVLACIHQRRDLRGWKRTDRLREGSPLDVPGVERLYDERRQDLYLFGYYARGDAEEGSDVDVLVILDEIESTWSEIQRTSELTAELSLEFGVTVCGVFTSERRWRAREAEGSDIEGL